MKKLILLFTLLVMVSPAMAAKIYDVSNDPAIYIDGMPLDKSIIMKTTYNASTHQVVILYGVKDNNQIIKVPGTQANVAAINTAVNEWNTFLKRADANSAKNNMQEQYEQQKQENELKQAEQQQAQEWEQRKQQSKQDAIEHAQYIQSAQTNTDEPTSALQKARNHIEEVNSVTNSLYNGLNMLKNLTGN